MRKALIYFILITFIVLPFQSVFAVDTDYRFTGQEYDPTADIYYFGQRYYEPDTGRFTQPDPILKNLHDPQKLRQQTNKDLEDILSNPQALNEYSYTVNNPVRYVDPRGEWFEEFFTGRQSWSSFESELGEASMYVNPVMEKAIDHPYITGAVIGVGTAFIAAGISSLAGGTSLLTSLGLVSRTLPPILISQSQRVFKGSQHLKNKEITLQGLAKLQEVSTKISKGINYIIKRASKSKSVFIDLRPENYGNVNVFFENPANSEKLIRVTLDPTLDKIISAGFARINQVTSWISEGQIINFTK